MNAERLLAHYERIADAPNAIARLRRFILDLAVRGKLVGQDAKDKPSPAMPKRAKRSEWLDGDGSDSEETISDDLPSSWQRVRVADVLDELQTGPFGSSLHQSDYETGGTPVVNPASIQDGRIIAIEKMAVGQSTLKRLSTFRLRGGDVVMARRGEMGRCAVVSPNEVGWLCGTGSLILRPSPPLCPEYLALLIGSPSVRAYLGGTAVGTTMQNLNQGILLRLRFGLPPLAEQQRIVAKVDELMALCDRLEAARAERETKRNQFTVASLSRLNEPDPDTFTDDTRFALNVLPTLTARHDQIKQLRESVLNLAVRGKLVPQDPKDEPATVLLEQVCRGRKPSRGNRRSRIERTQSDGREPCDFPALWTNVLLGDLCPLVTSGSRGWAEFYSKEGAGFIRAQNIRFGKLRLDDLAYVKPPSGTEGSRTRVLAGDLLIVITGAGVTNPAVLDRDLGEAYVSQHVGLARPLDARLSRWLLLCLMAPAAARTELVERAYGAGRPGLNLEIIRSLSIQLPPLAEQHRIVAKVDELMGVCDRLEASLAAGDDARSRLLNALLAEALQPAEMELEAA